MIWKAREPGSKRTNKKGTHETVAIQNWIPNQFWFTSEFNCVYIALKGKRDEKGRQEKKGTRKKNFKSNYTAHKRNSELIQIYFLISFRIQLHSATSFSLTLLLWDLAKEKTGCRKQRFNHLEHGHCKERGRCKLNFLHDFIAHGMRVHNNMLLVLHQVECTLMWLQVIVFSGAYRFTWFPDTTGHSPSYR